MIRPNQYLRDAFIKAVCDAAEHYGYEKANHGFSTQNSDVSRAHNKLMDDYDYRATFYKYSNTISSPKARDFDSTLSDLLNTLDQKDTLFCKEGAQLIVLVAKNFPTIAKIRYYESNMLNSFERHYDMMRR